MPMSARYRADYVTIPETWQGDKQVELFVSAVYTVGTGGLSAQAEDDSIEYIPNQRAQSTLFMGPGATPAEYAGDYSQSDVTVMRDDSGENGSGNSGTQTPASQNARTGTTGSPARTASTRSTAPRTGDALLLVAAAVTGVAGVAARTALNALKEREEPAAPADDSHDEES